jgi:pilus assembly protein CpaF
MKIWYNRLHDSRRTLVETASDVIRIGRDAGNTIVLQSPLVSKRHAVVTRENGKLKLENIGVNGRSRSRLNPKRFRPSAAANSKPTCGR